VFWQESGYFDTVASLKPLLHLWSLAVEEQFYIFFPPLLLLIWKRKWPLVAILGILLVISLVSNLWMSVHAGAADFFLTPYRVWEFLGGSLLAWWHYDKNHEEEVPVYREWLSWAGLMLLGLGMWMLHKEDPYPGWRAILPVAGTLLLMEGGRSAWINRKILSNPAVVWIGLISYPLYLFHWPALSFVHIVKGDLERGREPKPVYLADALMISLILSVITYGFIEKKIRHNKSPRTVPILVVLFILTGFAGFLASSKLVTSHYTSPRSALLYQAAKDSDMLKGLAAVNKSGLFYVHKVGGNGPQTLFLGDSNMQQYAPRLLNLLKDNQAEERGAILMTENGMLPLGNTVSNQSRDSSLLISSFKKELETNNKIDRVVIASRWCTYFGVTSRWKTDGISLATFAGKQKALDELDALLGTLVKQGKKVFLVLSIPTGSELDPKGIYPRNFMGFQESRERILTKETFLKKNGELLSEIASIGRQNGAEVIDPIDYLCTNGICIAEDELGIPIRFDDGHLRPGYVRERVKYLDGTVAP
jgi:hypothetical protein